MSKLQIYAETHEDEEPPGKKPRRNVQRKSNQPTRQSQRKRKLQGSHQPFNICDLPAEILEKIIGYVNIWHHNRIRGTSKRLRDINDLFVRHEFEKALTKHMEADPNSYESAALRVPLRTHLNEVGIIMHDITILIFCRVFVKPPKFMFVRVSNRCFVAVYFPCCAAPIRIPFVPRSIKSPSF